jgi:alpha-L-fucosidase
MSFGTGIVEVERGAFADTKAFPWQTDTAVARNSWCYTDTLDYKSSREVIATLIDVVSKNGNLLLNIGPKADGSIPDGDRQILSDLASWMKVNGEAIKESRVWRKAKEGPTEDFEGQFGDGTEKTYSTKDFRFTVKNGAVYAFAMNYPEDGHVVISSFKKSPDQNIPEFHGIIRKVEILGFDEQVDFEVTIEGLEFTTSTVKSEFPVVIKVVTA